MPVYEYECASCEKVFEIQQRIADDPIKNCPDCGEEVRKLISMSSFQLKGNGWYADGYSGSSNGNGKNGESTASKKEQSSSPPCQSGNAACKDCPAAT